MTVAKALCQKKLGLLDQGIATLQEHVDGDEFNHGLYDYFHLGVMYLEKGLNEQAIANLTIQEGKYDLAENAYYKAMAYKALGNRKAYLEFLQKAESLYKADQFMFDNYVHQIDKIYLATIKNELQDSAN